MPHRTGDVIQISLSDNLRLTILGLDLQIQKTLQRATLDSNSQVGAIFQALHSKELPPTYFRTNKFTTAFQEIVDAYG